MPLEKHKVILLTCFLVLSGGILDLVYEVNASRSRQQGNSIHSTADIPTFDPGALALSLGFTPAPGKTQAGFLDQLVPESLQKNIRGIVLLSKGDRGAEVTFLSGNDMSTLFTKLKTGLYLRFSPEVTDIEDVMRENRSGTTVHLFGFRDPQLAEERVLFIQKGTMLMEIHIAEGAGKDVEKFIQGVLEM